MRTNPFVKNKNRLFPHFLIFRDYQFFRLGGLKFQVQHLICCVKTSCGVSQPNDFLGLLFSSFWTNSSSSS
ncbi:MAG: hypothetical protein IKZ88_02435, partial [Neisseriaceae bacterium]|nr:hypothetical protein [Neisseriaceae bacterium]